ncbi:MAG: ribosomal-processing cysteine protease Prp [Eubacteriales bacterium]|nr:ribosomal-processing cysteine protease Prp [Eubacteriales bacterium]MDO4339974.1 ribosomal-processing cysteine protease Prp [Eubacteriales bacterium]
MIKITVKKRNHSYVSFTSSGHAGYAEEGQDIVCAAVSALIINTVNSLEAFTDDSIEAEEKDGYVSFHFMKPATERGTLLMDSLVLGLTDIAHSYKNRYLTIKVKEV